MSDCGSPPSNSVSSTSPLMYKVLENDARVSSVFLLILYISIEDFRQSLEPGLLLCLPLTYAVAEFVLYNNMTDRASSLSCSASIVIL